MVVLFREPRGKEKNENYGPMSVHSNSQGAFSLLSDKF